MMSIYRRFLMVGLLLTVCLSCIEYHPYDTKIDGQVGLNEKNMALIEAQCSDKSEVRFALVSDSQRWYDEFEDIIAHINTRSDIDFVIHAGDIADFGLRTEFELQRDIMQRLSVPFISLLGNHDCLGTGEIIFREMFGPYNFAFTAGNTRFVCLNTNALEFDYIDPVPDFSFLDNELLHMQSDVDRSVVVMHAQPYSDQFNNNVAKIFQAYITRLPSLQCCLHGHGHRFMESDIFNDGVIYYQCPSAEQRSYLVFTLNDEGYSYEKVNI